MRHSLAYASYRDRRPLARALRTLYTAPTAEAAAAALDASGFLTVPTARTGLFPARSVDLFSGFHSPIVDTESCFRSLERAFSSKIRSSAT